MEGNGRGDDWLAEQGELDWVHDPRGGDAAAEPPGRAPDRPRAERPAAGGAAAIARRRQIFALVGVALVIALVVLVVIVTSGGGGSPARDSSLTPTEPAVTTPTTTAPTTSAPRVTLPAAGHLSRGDTGPQVIALQKALNALGYDVGTPDGTFGPATEAAVIAFQKANGLTPDGAVGSKTAQALNKALASKSA